MVQSDLKVKALNALHKGMLDAGCWMEPSDFTQDKLLDVRNFFIAEAYKDFSLLGTAPRDGCGD